MEATKGHETISGRAAPEGWGGLQSLRLEDPLFWGRASGPHGHMRNFA